MVMKHREGTCQNVLFLIIRKCLREWHHRIDDAGSLAHKEPVSQVMRQNKAVTPFRVGHVQNHSFGLPTKILLVEESSNLVRLSHHLKLRAEEWAQRGQERSHIAGINAPILQENAEIGIPK